MSQNINPLTNFRTSHHTDSQICRRFSSLISDLKIFIDNFMIIYTKGYPSSHTYTLRQTEIFTHAGTEISVTHIRTWFAQCRTLTICMTQIGSVNKLNTWRANSICKQQRHLISIQNTFQSVWLIDHVQNFQSVVRYSIYGVGLLICDVYTAMGSSSGI